METSKAKAQINDEELTRLAVEQILKDSKIASIRAEQAGASAWSPHKKSINKKFLNNTLLSNAQFNKRKGK